MSKVNVVSIESLEKLKSSLVRFSGDTQATLQAVELEIRHTLDWLQERLQHWQREIRQRQENVARATAAWRACLASGNRDYHPDCSATEHAVQQAKMRLREAEGELRNVQHWLKVVQTSIVKYQAQTQRLKTVLYQDVPQATTQLGHNVASLKKYAASSQKNSESVWDYLRVEGNIGSLLREGTDTKGDFNPEIKITCGTKESAIWGDPKKDGLSFAGGFLEVGTKISLDDGVMIGAGGEFYALKGHWDTAIFGNEKYGITEGIEVKGLGLKGFVGVQFDGKKQQIGGQIGVNVISLEGSLGANVAGHNVSVTGELGLKAEFGFVLSSEDVALKMPFFSVGFRLGESIGKSSS